MRYICVYMYSIFIYYSSVILGEGSVGNVYDNRNRGGITTLPNLCLYVYSTVIIFGYICQLSC